MGVGARGGVAGEGDDGKRRAIGVAGRRGDERRVEQWWRSDVQMRGWNAQSSRRI